MPASKRKRRIVLGCVVVAVGTVAFGIYATINIRRAFDIMVLHEQTLHANYIAAYAISAFAEDEGRWPTGWDEVMPYIASMEYRVPWAEDDDAAVRRFVSVDFGRLPSVCDDAEDPPEVIHSIAPTITGHEAAAERVVRDACQYIVSDS